MADLDSLLLDFSEELRSASRVVVGFSGGLDSSVMLAAAANLVEPAAVLAVHINHQIDGKADHWQAHCKSFSEAMGCAFYSEKVRVDTESGIEENARRARYQVFERILGDGDILLLGHHADDQVETFLFRLFRGSGIKGLSAIPPRRTLGRGQILRPLLKCSKQRLKEIAINAGIEWIEDPSNEDSRFDRNFIRNELMLLVKDRWTAADKQLLHAIEILRETDLLLSEVALDDLETCELREEIAGASLSISKFREIRPLKQDNLLRRFVFEHGGFQPNQAFLQVLRAEVMEAVEDSQPCLRRGSLLIRRFKDRLYLVSVFPDMEVRDKAVGEWAAGSEAHHLPGVWKIELVEGAEVPLRVAFRAGGERARPLGRDGSQTLKKLMLEYDIEPWLRDWMPIIYRGEEIVAVGDRIQCSDFRFRMQWSIEQGV